MSDETLLALAADIISAHVSNNSVAPADLPILIQAVYGSLAKLGQAPEVVEVQREPAVSIRTSIKADSITCLECGAKMKMLKRHLSTVHQLSPTDYRDRWKLPANYPLVAPDYAAKRKELAVKIGLGRKPSVKVVAKEAKPRARKKLGVAFEAITSIEG